MRKKYPGLAPGYDGDDIIFDPVDCMMVPIDSEEENEKDDEQKKIDQAKLDEEIEVLKKQAKEEQRKAEEAKKKGNVLLAEKLGLHPDQMTRPADEKEDEWEGYRED